MASHRRRERVVRRIVLRGAVAVTLVAALGSAGALSFAQASSTMPPVAPGSAVATGPTVADLLPPPAAPDLDLPDVPLPDPEPAAITGSSGHCDDPAWWNARQAGDPSDYVAACGEWPSWIDRDEEMPCPPGERNCTTASRSSGAAPYTGPTVDRPWSPEYGYYEGRTDGPMNSRGEPCMQGRDNVDPNC
jgi:hypothetical protein